MQFKIRRAAVVSAALCAIHAVGGLAIAQSNAPERNAETPKEQTNAAESELSVVVEVADGSRVVGVPSVKELNVATQVGKIQIPLKKVIRIVFGSGEKETTVALTHGDRLSGVIDGTSMDLKTAWGNVSLPMSQMQKLTVQSPSTRWNVREEFSTTSDPNGPWSYGWISQSGGAFTVFRSQCRSSGGVGWRLDPETPNIWINLSEHVLYGVKPGDMSLHPGRNGEEAVIRWQAPRTCVVTVNGAFGAGDRGSMSVRVRHNEKVLFESNDTPKDEPFSLEFTVNVGDVVDFGVTPGSEGYAYGNTPLDAVISVK